MRVPRAFTSNNAFGCFGFIAERSAVPFPEVMCRAAF